MINVDNYFKPKTLNEALDILEQNENKMKILAGGTDLVIQLKNSGEKVDILDIGDIEELKFIKEDSEKVSFGSLVTFTEVQFSDVILKNYAALAQAASVVGAPQIRNQGTIAGNIANASPAADSVPALVAVDAEVLLASVNGQRRLKVVDFLKGINQTDIQKNEMIVEISFKKIPGLKSGFAKLGKRNALAISRISAAVGIVCDENDVITASRVSLGAVAPNPFRSQIIEDALKGKRITDGVPEDVLEAAHIDVKERLGNRSSAPYKREAIKGVLRQALEKAFSSK